MLRLGEVARRLTAPAALLLGFLALPLVAACTTNHDALARQPAAGGAGGGGGGSAGFPSGGSGNTGNQAQGGRVNPDDEPAGDDVLTLVNGVVDTPSVQVCFARLDDEGNAELVGSPLPELAYATSTVLTELAELSFEQDVLQPWLIAGDLAQIDGLDCAEAVELAREAEAAVTPEPEPEDSGAGGASGAAGATFGAEGGAGPALEKPALRARALAALPAGTVAIGRSILMVLSGCLGGAAYDGASVSSVCGEGYAPDAPTAQPVVVKLSRDFRFDKVGLQGLHASLAMGSADLRVSGDNGSVALVFASSVTFGEVSPRPSDTRFSVLDVGAGDARFGLQAIGENAEVLHQAAWPELMEAAGLSSVSAARTYTAVLLGPRPRLFPEGWWNPPAFALVDNDPTRQ